MQPTQADAGDRDAASPVTRILSLAHAHLGMDASFISQCADGVQVVRALAGDSAPFGLALDEPLTTACEVLANEHAAPPDDQGDRSGPRACVGVPLTLPSGEVYGTLCCVGHEAASLNDSDRNFMKTLADLLADLLRRRGSQRQHAKLVEATAAERVTVALQPVVNVMTGRLVGAEALPRLPGGLGSPDDTVDQGAGAGVELEIAAFEASLALAQRLPAEAYIAVNVSPAVLMDRRMVEALRCVEDPARCVLELSERHSVDGNTDLAGVLTELRGRGFRVAVDDVGAGYSSFHHVLELVPEIVKIDRSLVAGVAGDAARQRLISSIVLLGLDLDATVVAEGVEHADDLAAVLDLGVTTIQGDLVGPPTLDWAEVEAWRAGWHVRAGRPKSLQAERRARFGALLRELRGERRQVDVLRAVNEHLAAAGQDLRVSQGQYSAYEHGRELPHPVRLRAIEAVLGVAPGELADKVPKEPEGSRTGARRRMARRPRGPGVRPVEIRRNLGGL